MHDPVLAHRDLLSDALTHISSLLGFEGTILLLTFEFTPQVTGK